MRDLRLALAISLLAGCHEASSPSEFVVVRARNFSHVADLPLFPHEIDVGSNPFGIAHFVR